MNVLKPDLLLKKLCSPVFLFFVRFPFGSLQTEAKNRMLA